MFACFLFRGAVVGRADHLPQPILPVQRCVVVLLLPAVRQFSHPGHPLPGDICAEVLEDKAGFRKGDVVFGFAAGGALAQYTTVRPTAVVRKPEGLSVVEAGVVLSGVCYLSPWGGFIERERDM